MSRRGKGQLIETWEHHRYKEKVNIHLSKETGMFSAEYGESILQSATLEDMRNQLSKTVESLTKLDWIPVILISLDGHTRFHRDKKVGRGATQQEDTDTDDERTEKGRAEFNLHFERFWLAKQQSGEWLCCHIWHSEDVDGKSDRYNYNHDRPINDPMPRRLNAGRFYLHGEDAEKFKLPYKTTDKSFNENRQLHYVKYTPELWAGLNEVAFKIDDLIEKLGKLLGSDKGLLLVEGLVQKLLPGGEK